MKSNVFFAATFLLSIAMAGCAGIEKAPPVETTFEAIYEVPGAPKDKIFSAEKTWIAETFASARSVIEHEDRQEGLIVVKGAIKYQCTGGMDCVARGGYFVRFTMRMYTKDEKIKLAFSDLYFSTPQPMNIYSQRDIETIKPSLIGLGQRIQAAILHGKSGKEF